MSMCVGKVIIFPFLRGHDGPQFYGIYCDSSWNGMELPCTLSLSGTLQLSSFRVALLTQLLGVEIEYTLNMANEHDTLSIRRQS